MWSLGHSFFYIILNIMCSTSFIGHPPYDRHYKLGYWGARKRHGSYGLGRKMDSNKIIMQKCKISGKFHDALET